MLRTRTLQLPNSGGAPGEGGPGMGGTRGRVTPWPTQCPSPGPSPAPPGGRHREGLSGTRHVPSLVPTWPRTTVAEGPPWTAGESLDGMRRGGTRSRVPGERPTDQLLWSHKEPSGLKVSRPPPPWGPVTGHCVLLSAGQDRLDATRPDPLHAPPAGPHQPRPGRRLMNEHESPLRSACSSAGDVNAMVPRRMDA